MSVMVQARIDPKVKEEAAEVLADMGLSISDAVRLMLVRTAKEKTLPFEVWRPNAETRAAMAEAMRDDLKSFDSVEALMEDLNADD